MARASTTPHAGSSLDRNAASILGQAHHATESRPSRPGAVRREIVANDDMATSVADGSAAAYAPRIVGMRRPIDRHELVSCPKKRQISRSATVRKVEAPVAHRLRCMRPMTGRRQSWLLGALLAVAGCVGSGVEDTARDRGEISGTCGAWAGTYSGVTFTDEQATHAIDMADHATAEELRALHGVGPSIASRIIGARPFASQPDPLAALDGVAYVGENVLTSFRDRAFASWCALDDGRQSCCFQVPCEAGATSGVAFTAEQTHNVLEWANYATRDELTAVCGVGPSIAAGIEAARPIDSLAALDAVPYVGATVLHRMLGDAGYECAAQGSQGRPVEYDWCMERDCVCEAASPLSCTAPTAYETLEELSDEPALQAFAAELVAAGNPCDPSNANPLILTIVEVCLVGHANYVELVQEQTDPDAQATEGSFHLYYQFDDDLEITSSSCEGPTAPEPTVEDYVCEGSLECVSTLDPNLRAVVDDLLVNGPKCEDSVYFPVTYGYLTITSVSETPSEYVVNLMQMIDPEGGIQCWMRYTVGADYEVTDGPDIYI